MSDDLIKDCRTAAKCLEDCGSFETGQSILREAADRIEALEAKVSRAAQQTDKAIAVVVEEIADFCEDATPSPEWGDDTKSTYRFAGKDIARSVRKFALDDAKATVEADIEKKISAALEPGQTHREGWDAAIEAAENAARKTMQEYAREKGNTKTPGGRTANFYKRKVSESIRNLPYPGDE